MTRMTILAGGTGGHVMPALAVAKVLRDKGVDINWIGTSQGIESHLVPESRIAFDSIDIKGIRKSGMARKIMAPFLLLKAVFQSFRLMRKYKPGVVLGMGGFVSGPGGLTAVSLKLPVVIHEQNSVAGMTNRWLARWSRTVLTGFPEAAGISEFCWVGNPVRQEIIDIPEPEIRLSNRTGPLKVLVVGGSQGAGVFNRELPGLCAAGDAVELDIWHQSGRSGRRGIEEAYAKGGVKARVNEFIDNMHRAYQWCDVIICRSGAMTVSEVCCAGVTAIFVPYPSAVGDHQAANAQYLVKEGAAFMVRQDEFIKGNWLHILSDLSRDRRQLADMSAAARKLSKPGAAAAVADKCMEVIHA